MGGLLDRYVLRRFVATYGLCLSGFLLLFLVMDFFGKLDDFLRSERAITKAGLAFWPFVAEYFATKLPLMLTTIGPYLTLFAGIATLITFGRQNEITPMVAAGRSHHRVLAPVYAFSILAVFGLVTVEEHVVPRALARHRVLDRIVEGGERGEARKVPHLRDPATGNRFTAQTWLPSQQRLVEVHAPSYRDASGQLPLGMFDAAELVYRTHRGVVGWYPVGGTLTPLVHDSAARPMDEIVLAHDRPIALAIEPREVDLLAASEEPGLERAELATLIARNPQNFALVMQLHTRTTRPVSSLVLLLLGLPFVTRVGRMTIAQGLGVALLTCVGYAAVDLAFQQLGNRDALPPLVAAWFAPCLFGAVAIARLDRVGT